MHRSSLGWGSVWGQGAQGVWRWHRKSKEKHTMRADERACLCEVPAKSTVADDQVGMHACECGRAGVHVSA